MRTGATDAKRRAGNLGGRPVNPVQHNTRVPDVPDTLGPAGQRAWVELWTAGTWLVPSNDWHAMNILAQNFDQREVWRDEVRKHPIVKGSMGQRQPNPAARQLLAVEASIRDWLKQLGFFKPERAEEAANDLDRFLSSGLPS